MLLYNRFLDVAAETTFTAQRPKMNRARKKVQVKGCNSVKNLITFAEFLDTPAGKNALKHSYRKTSESDPKVELSHSIVKDANGFQHVILKNEVLLNKLSYTTSSNIDGTFASRPKFHDCKQLLTILVRAYDKVVIKLTSYLFLSSVNYKLIMNIFFSVLPMHLGVNV